MSVAVLIPYREDFGQRDRLFSYVVKAWEQAGVPVYVGYAGDAGPFNVSRAFNNAFRLAVGDGHDKVAMFGADHVPQPHVLEVADAQLDAWLPLFAQTGGYSQFDTECILDGRVGPERCNFVSIVGMCTGILAVHADAWRDLRGMDERFAGWGAEDTAFRAALSTIYGEREPLPGVLGHLWHEAAPRAEATNANVRLFHGLYEPAIGNPAAMRAVVEQRENQ